MKRLFIVDDGCPEDHAELVVAENSRQAEIICGERGDLEADYPFDISEVTSWYCSTKKIPQKEIDDLDWGIVNDSKHNGKFRREVGFSCEGDDRCCTCGLAEFDGRFPVCPECNQCSECGCDDDCEEAKIKAEEEKEEENVSV